MRCNRALRDQTRSDNIACDFSYTECTDFICVVVSRKDDHNTGSRIDCILTNAVDAFIFLLSFSTTHSDIRDIVL